MQCLNQTFAKLLLYRIILCRNIANKTTLANVNFKILNLHIANFSHLIIPSISFCSDQLC